MESSPARSAPASKRLEPFLVGIFLLFVVFFIANGFLVYFSSSSWTGLVSHNHYQEGLAYNATLAQQKAESALGWKVSVDASGLAAHQEGVLRVALMDRDGHPLQGGMLAGLLYRPVQETQDIAFALDEIAPGIYTSKLKPTSPGHWGVKLTAKVREETFHHHVRIFLPEHEPGR